MHKIIKRVQDSPEGGWLLSSILFFASVFGLLTVLNHQCFSSGYVYDDIGLFDKETAAEM